MVRVLLTSLVLGWSSLELVAKRVYFYSIQNQEGLVKGHVLYVFLVIGNLERRSDIGSFCWLTHFLLSTSQGGLFSDWGREGPDTAVAWVSVNLDISTAIDQIPVVTTYHWFHEVSVPMTFVKCVTCTRWNLKMWKTMRPSYKLHILGTVRPYPTKEQKENHRLKSADWHGIFDPSQVI